MKNINAYTAGAILLGITFVGLLFAAMPTPLALSLGLVHAESIPVAETFKTGEKSTGAKVEKNIGKSEFGKFVDRRNRQIKCIEEKYSLTIIQADYLFDDYTFTSSAAQYPAGGEMKDFKGVKMDKICGL